MRQTRTVSHRALVVLTVLAMTTLSPYGIASAQNLAQNQFYTRSIEFGAAARTAFEEGNYDRAAELANLAAESATLSDEYVATILAMKAAGDAIESAQTRYAWAESVQAARRYAAAFAGAGEGIANAWTLYDSSLWAEARAAAERAEALLSGIRGDDPLPALFLVRKRPGNEDCLWNIAALPSVYNDPHKWPHLYRANKGQFPQPANPDLIVPGMTIVIPSIAGEVREGLWMEDGVYSVFSGLDG